MTYPKQPTTDAEALAYAKFLTETRGSPSYAYKSAPGPNGHHYCVLRAEEAQDFIETGWTRVEEPGS